MSDIAIAEKNTALENSAEGEKKYKLKKSFEYEGKIYEEFNFNFEKLTGNDMIEIEGEMRDQGIFILSPENDTAFLSAIAARACNVHPAVIKALPMTDFLAVKRLTVRFLNGKD